MIADSFTKLEKRVTMTDELRTQPDQESRLLAALAHGSAIAQGIGLVVGLTIYLTQREKSRFAASQALQAAVYQLVSLVLVMGSWLVWGVCYGLSFIPMIITSADASEPPVLFYIGLGSMAIPFALMIILGLYALWGALRAWQGHDFRYILIGSWLEKSSLLDSHTPAPTPDEPPLA
jgi:uncharacterized Tic20 family protein